MTSVYRLAATITAHAWNKDHTMLAMCPNSPEVWIYTNCDNSDMSKWQRKYVLKQHDLTVSSIDWSPVTNKILTCSADRNAFVWNYEASSDSWDPTLVVLRSDRAAICAKWSPDGKKFAVGTSAKTVIICTYEEANTWWVGKPIRKAHKATVLSVAWHPNSQLLASVSCDGHASVWCALTPETGESAVEGPYGVPGVDDFGKLYQEFGHAKAWLTSVAFSPDGSHLACTSQTSRLYVMPIGSGQTEYETITSKDLPFTTVDWLSNQCIVAAGHDFKPALFCKQNGKWAFTEFLDKSAEKTANQGSSNSAFSAARAMFASRVTRGEDAPSTKDKLNTLHEAPITCLSLFRENVSSNASVLSSSGLDGRIVIWKLKDLSISAGMQALGL